MKKSTKELLTRFALLSETSLIVLSGCHHAEPICTSERPDNTSVEQTTEEPWQTNLPPYFTYLDKVDFSNENNLTTDGVPFKEKVPVADFQSIVNNFYLEKY